MTLPTREEGMRGAGSFRNSYLGLTPSSADLWVQTILDAYADGVLMTREEWLATIAISPQTITIAGNRKMHGGHWELTGYSNFPWPKTFSYGDAFYLVPVDAALEDNRCRKSFDECNCSACVEEGDNDD